ncbi:hypothetical protein MED121_10869 [Marinomonas sp. MED121]|uniref:hypothetical protein n=1 Tax=Marinomonas sp. MED121 TaxID=314277 RepID=UPI0000690C0E|nr:hypothetical protein [Marinomonas sp. MED121]EAQ64860.1 hypothetical protein MED121_10869 [Marinomonas sp. MED121]
MRKIAIIDDDKESRLTMKFKVEDAGFEPVLITGAFGNDKARLMDEIYKNDVYGVISDHRLSPLKLASFYGADLLADLYDQKMPTILITQFLDEDADTTIRKFRDRLPSVIGRGDDHNDDLISDLLTLSKNEIELGPRPDRKSHRALIRIYNLQDSIVSGVVEGVVTNWKSDTKIRFPIDMIPAQVRDTLLLQKKDITRISAFVNIGANDSKEIFITDTHVLPSLEGVDINEFC